MAHEELKPIKSERLLELAGVAADRRVTVKRIETRKGAVTRTHHHETECLVVVLEGAWRVHLSGRIVTINENETVRIPPQSEHLAEALADTVALSISSSPHGTDCGAFFCGDPDQYLWGV